MHLRLQFSDIVDVAGDALIYSTNVRLALTGGVGAALVEKFGAQVQIDLQNASEGFGSCLAEVGDVIECPIAESPWKRVFHTVATDESYHTRISTVRSILERCLRRCAEVGDVRSIVCSALGAGYGDLGFASLAALAVEVCQGFYGSPIRRFTLVTSDPTAREVLPELADCWTVGP